MAIIILSSQNSLSNQAMYEQQPPIAKSAFVQKLASPLSNGNNMILRIEYYADSTLPDIIELYSNGNIAYTLKDNGVFPYSVAGDFNYATYINENISNFLGKISSLETQIQNKGGVFQFEGHDGMFVKSDSIGLFNVEAFNNHEQVPITPLILNAVDCENQLLKQNSLFITHLDVVEDPARTYNVYNNTGNPYGAWTFGTLMKNIANTNVTGVSTKSFLKEWVKTWTQNYMIGSFANNNAYNNLSPRGNSKLHLIHPWIVKAWTMSPPNGQPATPPDNNELNNNGWEYYWDILSEDALVKNAPFKLMAIVNRIDLRGNPIYTSNMHNGGETRFIYTLINPFTGKPPIHNDAQSGPFGAEAFGLIDWIGMNVILEYGNPINNLCDIKDFAQQWYDLSSYTLGSTDYNDALEQITNTVTLSNKAPGKNYNKSALNQIRTNEKILDKRDPGNEIKLWADMDWELRQFELNSNGYLEPTLLTNTPIDEAHTADHHSFNDASFSMNNLYGNLVNNSSINNFNDKLLNWIYGNNGNSINRIRVSKGNHILPEGFLAAAARVYRENAHYFGFNWNYLPQNVYNPNTYDENTDMPDELAKKIRHQISLNTCQGCHGGENKTNFTHVFPRGYGEEAVYWGNTLTVVNYNPNPFGPVFGNTIDDRFDIFSDINGQHKDVINFNKTYDKYTQTHELNLDIHEKENNATNQIVSPFITGRKYSNYNGLPNPWQDDELNDGGEILNGNKPELSDEKLTGFYIVNDPSNQSTTLPMIGLPTLALYNGGRYPQKHDQRWKFNELELRKQHLCKLLNSSCTFGTTLDILGVIFFVPFPLHSH